MSNISPHVGKTVAYIDLVLSPSINSTLPAELCLCQIEHKRAALVFGWFDEFDRLSPIFGYNREYLWRGSGRVDRAGP